MPKFESQIITALNRLDMVQRVRSVLVTPEPEAIQFRFNTHVPTSPIVEVFNLKMRVKAGEEILVFEGAEIVRVAFDFLGVARGTRHAIRMDRLNQEREYMFRITAGGGLGAPAVITGRSRTGRRDVEFIVRDIGIWDDGDPGIFNGAGELEFGFALYGYDDRRLVHRTFPCEANSGDLIKWPFGRGERGRNSSLRVNFAPDSLTVYVLGVENDSIIPPFHPWAEPPLKLPPYMTAQKSSDWIKVDVMLRYELPTQTGEYRLGVNLKSGPHGIHYFVTGWLDVRVSNPPARRIIGSFETSRILDEWAVLRKGVATAIGSGQDAGSDSNIWLGADGVLSVGMLREGSRAPEWQLVPGEPIDEAVVVKSGGSLRLVARFGDELRRSTVSADGSLESPWAPARAPLDEPVAHRLHGPLTMAHGPRALAVAVPGDHGVLVIVLNSDHQPEFDFTVADSSCTRIALAWTSDETLGLVGLRPSGTVVEAGWQLSGGVTSAQWKELDGPVMEAVTIVPATGDAPAMIVGLTDERKIFVRPHDRSDEAGQWEPAGYLDQVISQEEPGKVTIDMVETDGPPESVHN